MNIIFMILSFVVIYYVMQHFKVIYPDWKWLVFALGLGVYFAVLKLFEVLRIKYYIRKKGKTEK